MEDCMFTNCLPVVFHQSEVLIVAEYKPGPAKEQGPGISSFSKWKCPSTINSPSIATCLLIITISIVDMTVQLSETLQKRGADQLCSPFSVLLLAFPEAVSSHTKARSIISDGLFLLTIDSRLHSSQEFVSLWKNSVKILEP